MRVNTANKYKNHVQKYTANNKTNAKITTA